MESVVWRVSEFFLLSLAMGLSLFSFMANPKFTGAGFLKLINSVCLGALILAFACYLTGQPLRDWQAGAYCAIFLCLGGGLIICSEKRTSLSWSVFSLQNILFLFLLSLFSQIDWGPFFFLLTSALMTGIVTYSLLLGHWYLVVFDLPIHLLKRVILVFWGLLALKLTVSCLEAFDLFQAKSKAQEGSFFMLVFLMRILWGYVIIAVMSVFAWKLVKIRSTQSATGIFYTMTFFVFIGEIISIYLFLRYGFFI